MKRKNLRAVCYLIGVLSTSMLYSHVAWAANNQLDPQAVLGHLLEYLTGGFGKTVAAIAFVVTGIGSMVMGKFGRGWFYGVVVGIIIVFGSDYILTGVLQVGGQS